MNKILSVALAAGVALVALAPASARDGCGPGAHRGPYGHCRPNGYYRPGVIAGPLIIHQYYPGRGYWDGHRYWWHRDRFHGEWRYR